MTRFDLHMAKTPALPFADAEEGVTMHERHCHCSADAVRYGLQGLIIIIIVIAV
jgi:hypothetical protein